MNRRKILRNPLTPSLSRLAFGAAALVSAGPAFAARITGVDFKGTQSPNLLEIRSDGAIKVERQDSAPDKQIILDLRGASITKAVGREIDTSSFNSRVTLIKAYAVAGEKDHVRVVVQLRGDASDADVRQSGNVVTLSIPAPDSVGSSSAAPVAAAAASTDGSAGSDESTASVPKSSARGNSGDGGMTATEAARIDAAIDLSPGRKYMGRPITLKVREMEASDIFRLVGEASGFNIVISEDVKGKLTLSLEDVPWDQALAIVLQALHLGAERTGNVLRISTLENLTLARQRAYQAAQANEAAAPRITRVFPISYANLKDLVGVIGKTLNAGGSTASGTGAGTPGVPAVPGATPGAAPGPGPGPGPVPGNLGAASAIPTAFTAASAGANGQSAAGGALSGGGGGAGSSDSSGISSANRSIVADTRTNSLIVRDTAQNVERIRKLIEILDVQTPQVIIEGKVVEASEAFSHSIDGALGGGGSFNSSSFVGSANQGIPIDNLIGSATPGFPLNSDFAAASKGAGLLSLSFLPGTQRLNALLKLAESESQTRVIASPRAVVLDKQKASIVQATPVLVPTTVAVGNGATGGGVSLMNANLSLDVTPTVTNDSNVMLDLTLERDVPVALGDQSGVAGRKVSTQVLVEAGSTLVLGGFYTMTQNHNATGFPVLRKIPILGWLFGSEADNTDRSELFFFVTPQILNAKKAGLEG